MPPRPSDEHGPAADNKRTVAAARGLGPGRPKAPAGAGGSGGPGRQSHSAHHPQEVPVHYPWHPLHSQTILVTRSVRRHGRDVWLCEQDQRTADIPVWMTDRVACAALSLGPVLVSVDALIELALLVSATHAKHDHITRPSQEEPDATSTTAILAANDPPL